MNSVEYVPTPRSNMFSWLISLRHHLPTSDCGIYRFTSLSPQSLLTAQVPLLNTHLLDRVKCNRVEPMEHLDHWLSVHNGFLFSLEAIIASISSQDVEMHQGARQFYLPGGLILWTTLWPTLILTVFLLCWAIAVSEALATIPENHGFLSAECTLTPQLLIFLFASLCVPFDGSPFSSRFPGKAGKLQRNSECPHWLLPSHLILMLGWCTCTPLEFHSYYNRSLKFWLWI